MYRSRTRDMDWLTTRINDCEHMKIMWTANLEKTMKAMCVVMNTIGAIVEIRPEKKKKKDENQAYTGFEPMTFAILV